MSARVFISYRSADGADKATALARDLDQRFGPEQVFLDKDDLRGGSSWRDAVREALDARPVVLLLMTPQLFAAVDAAGQLRIADPDDPVRREFEAALAAGATIIPLLCDGVDAPPPARTLPPPFERIGDFTWRKLRAYDWRNDFERLAEDLQAAGLVPKANQVADPHATGSIDGAAPGPGMPSSGTASPGMASATRRSLLIGGSIALLAAGVFGWRRWDEARREAAAAAAAPLALPGTWIASVGADPPFALTLLLQQDDRLVLTSEPMPVDNRAGWEAYREFWIRLTGTALKDIVYRGQGTVIRDPGVPLAIDLAWRLFNGAGDTLIDSGNLHAAVAVDRRSLAGTLWSNGDQAARPIVLRRPQAAAGGRG
jgi:hypothetical protein